MKHESGKIDVACTVVGAILLLGVVTYLIISALGGRAPNPAILKWGGGFGVVLMIPVGQLTAVAKAARKMLPGA